jgi:hypothetical protein
MGNILTLPAWETTLKISRLHEGDIFYNFKELQRAIGIETGRRIHKEPVLNELFRFVDFKCVNGGYVINRIREVPFHKKAPGQYQELIQVLIHALLASTNDLMIETTYKQLFTDIAMSSPNYVAIYNEDAYEFLVKDLSAHNAYVPPSDVFDRFRRTAGSSLKEKVRLALNYMKDQQLVLWEEGLWICHDLVLEGFRIDKDDQRFIHMEASKEEKSKYLNARRTVLLEKYNTDNIKAIYKSNKGEQYKKDVNKYIRDVYGWRYAYSRLKIWYNYEDVKVSLQAAINSLVEESKTNDIELQKDKLNAKIVDMIKNRGEGRRREAIKKLVPYKDGNVWGDMPEEVAGCETMAMDGAKIAWDVLTGYFISKDADMTALSALRPENQYDDMNDDPDFGIV